MVVAEPRPIAHEWRLIVAEGAVVAASQYLVGGKIVLEPGCPRVVLEFAAGMLAAVPWRPDEIFMADVCESGGELFLLELNGFNSSAVYPCDYRAVVSVASELAARRWQRWSAQVGQAFHSIYKVSLFLPLPGSTTEFLTAGDSWPVSELSPTITGFEAIVGRDLLVWLLLVLNGPHNQFILAG